MLMRMSGVCRFLHQYFHHHLDMYAYLDGVYFAVRTLELTLSVITFISLM